MFFIFATYPSGVRVILGLIAPADKPCDSDSISRHYDVGHVGHPPRSPYACPGGGVALRWIHLGEERRGRPWQRTRPRDVVRLAMLLEIDTLIFLL